MSISTSMQTRRPIMSMEDSDGNGIPDGAEINFKHTEVDPDSGATRVTSASWTKKTPPENRPMMDVPEYARPRTAEQQGAQPIPVSESANPWDAFQDRTDRAADRAGMARSNYNSRPMLEADEKAYLLKTSQNGALRPELRAQAGRRLAMMDANTGRREDMASMERQTYVKAAGTAAAQQAANDTKVQIAETAADARVGAATATAEQRQREQESKLQLERDKMAQRDRIEKARLEAWKTRDQDKASLRAARDKATLQRAAETYLDKGFGGDIMNPGKTLRQYIVETYDQTTGQVKPNATVDPVFEDRLEFLNQRWQELNGKPYLTNGKSAEKLDNPNSPAAAFEASRRNQNTTTLTADQQAAVAWINANPTDPRVPAMRKKLGLPET